MECPQYIGMLERIITVCGGWFVNFERLVVLRGIMNEAQKDRAGDVISAFNGDIEQAIECLKRLKGSGFDVVARQGGEDDRS